MAHVIPSLLCTLIEHTLNALSCSDGGDCSVLGVKERTCICVTVGIVHTIFMFVPMYLVPHCIWLEKSALKYNSSTIPHTNFERELERKTCKGESMHVQFAKRNSACTVSSENTYLRVRTPIYCACVTSITLTSVNTRVTGNWRNLVDFTDNCQM